MKRIEASETALHKVFSSDFDFEIPDYQRPYSWGTEESLQLLADLRDCLEREADEPYFLGSVVLIKEPSEPRALVIDGQQRLTTLTILFAVIRDLCTDRGLAAEIQGTIVEPGQILLSRVEKPRLSLRPRDQAFFKAHVLTPGGVLAMRSDRSLSVNNDAQVNLRDNALALAGELHRWPEEHRTRLAAMLTTRTFLVVVSTQDLSSAHRIFSVMNSRGLDLTPSDIFKARVLGAVGPDFSASYTAKWEDAEQALGRSAFTELFLHLRLIISKRRAVQNLLEEFPKQVLAPYLPGGAMAFIDEVLVPYSDAYLAVTQQNYVSAEGAEVVNTWLRRLAELDSTDWQPAALWAIRHHAGDPQWLAGFLQRLERLAASMFIRRVYTTTRLTRYVELLRQLDAGTGLDAPALRLADYERDEALRLLNGDVYLSTKTRRYVLQRLDEALAAAPGVSYQHKVVTVEHVLPQNPAAESQWRATFTDEQRSEWVHRLANLVLLSRSKNSQAQNYDFARKKQQYFQAGRGVATFALTSQVLAHEEWTPQTLKTRQAHLLSLARKMWAF